MATNELAPKMGIINQLYRKMVPVNARTLIDTAMGDTSPITEANFEPDELAVLRNIYDAKQNTNENWKQSIANDLAISENQYNKNPEMRLVQGNRKGLYVSEPMPYADFIQNTVNKLDSFSKTQGKTSISYNDYPDNLAAPTFDSWLTSIKKSYTDPAYRMKTTLGGFNVNETPEGPVATDNYNFDAGDYYKSQGVDFQKDNAYDLYKKSNGPVDFLDMLMIKHRPSSSRPVNIKLPQGKK